MSDDTPITVRVLRAALADEKQRRDEVKAERDEFERVYSDVLASHNRLVKESAISRANVTELIDAIERRGYSAEATS